MAKKGVARVSTPTKTFLNTWRFRWSRLVLKMVALIEYRLLAGPDRNRKVYLNLPGHQNGSSHNEH